VLAGGVTQGEKKEAGRCFPGINEVVLGDSLMKILKRQYSKYSLVLLGYRNEVDRQCLKFLICNLFAS
jgi:hypothetical protein